MAQQTKVQTVCKTCGTTRNITRMICDNCNKRDSWQPGGSDSFNRNHGWTVMYGPDYRSVDLCPDCAAEFYKKFPNAQEAVSIR